VALHFALTESTAAALAVPTDAANTAALRKAVALSELTFMSCVLLKVLRSWFSNCH
jgi:hypothetical protein